MKRMVVLLTALVTTGLALGLPYGEGSIFSLAAASSGEAAVHPVEVSSLSTYWPIRLRRWEALIMQEAERRELDPDFLASLVWRESRGDPNAVGPAGAVGLMQVMPKEAGFSWRPARKDLLVPSTNLYWGTRTLATVIRQGNGDVFNALAAYNAGWDQAGNRRPKLFASTILREYAQAVVHRHGLTGEWTAFFAVKDQGIRGPIWVVDGQRDDVYFYGNENATPEGYSLIAHVAPTAIVARCHPEDASPSYEVGIWIRDETAGRWVSGETGAPPRFFEALIDVAASGSHYEAVSPSVMAGSSRPTAPFAPAGSDAADQAVEADAVSAAEPAEPPAGSSVVIDAGAEGDADDDGATDPHLTASAEPTPMPTESVPCAGGPLLLDAWPLDRMNTPEGWMVRIYAEARGGDCRYTYAWNEESDVRGEDLPGPIVFEVTSTRRDSPLLGTVVVLSAGEVRRVQLYINPPD
ncbi:MAG: transglycosylase SLT domain-containing protein [Anaerolineae bacterium]